MDTLWSTLYFAFNAIAPILLLILLGYFAKKKNFINDTYLKAANKFNFRFAFPCLMFCNMYSLDNFNEIPLKLALFLLTALIVITVVGFVVANLFTNVTARKGVLIQATFRSNYAIIGIPIAMALGGEAGKMLASALQSTTVIYFNFMAVLCMSIYSENSKGFSFKDTLLKIMKNPLIQGLLAGTLVLYIRQFIPVDADGELVFSIERNFSWLYTFLKYMSAMATPMALIVLGGQFTFQAVKNMKKELTCGILMRLIVTPVIGFLLTFTAKYLGLIELDTAVMSALITAFGSPLAVSSVVMASEMGSDDILAGQLVVWTSILSMVTLFLQIVLFRSLGLL